MTTKGVKGEGGCFPAKWPIDLQKGLFYTLKVQAIDQTQAIHHAIVEPIPGRRYSHPHAVIEDIVPISSGQNTEQVAIVTLPLENGCQAGLQLPTIFSPTGLLHCRI